MVRSAVKVIDNIIAFVTACFFLVGIDLIMLFSLLRPAKKSCKDGIVELYMSIIDLDDAVVSTYRNDFLLDGFKKMVFSYHFDFSKAKDSFKEVEKNLLSYNISVHPDNYLTKAGLRRSAAALSEVKAFFSMLKTILKNNVNIIRAQDPHLLGFNAFVLSRIAKIPFIVQVCSNYEVKDRQAKGLTFRPFMFKALERRFERALMRSSDMVMTDREHYREFGLIPKDIPADRYANIGFFVDPSHYTLPALRKDLKAELGIESGKKVLLYVGRLCGVKYPLDLVKMLEVCLLRRKDIMLVIAGDGDLKGPMEALITDKKMDNNVMFLKTVSQDKLKDLYHTADIVCFTSAGFTMIEAGLAEKYIIAYDFEWHSEFIGKNERGVLVPFGDYKKFAEEVLLALDDDDKRTVLGKAARDLAVKDYARGIAIKKEISAYIGIFNKRGVNLEKAV